METGETQGPEVLSDQAVSKARSVAEGHAASVQQQIAKLQTVLESYGEEARLLAQLEEIRQRRSGIPAPIAPPETAPAAAAPAPAPAPDPNPAPTADAHTPAPPAPAPEPVAIAELQDESLEDRVWGGGDDGLLADEPSGETTAAQGWGR